MNRSVVQAAHVIGADGQQVKKWAWTYKEHLSRSANPPKGHPRTFTDSDLLALMYICDRSELGETKEDIHAGLDREDHYDNDSYRDMLYTHTPILQEPPDDLDETWRHGILLSGGSVDGYLALARNYRESAEALLERALKSGQPRDLSFPVLFAYRHALELYLKIIGEIDDHTHSLKECVRQVEKRHGEHLPSNVRGWMIELDEIDPNGLAFRYADDVAGERLRTVEYWLDFQHFQFAMTRVFRILDTAILNAVKAGKIGPTRL